MKDPQPQAPATAEPRGLIDTLQAGFTLTNNNAWLLLLPVAIDLLLWWGPQLTLGPLADRWLADVAAIQAVGQGGPGSTSADQPLAELLRQSEGLSRYNLLSFLAVPLLGVPSFRAGAPGQGTAFSLDSPALVAAALACITAVGLCAAAAYYGMLGQAVRDGRAAPARFLEGFRQTFPWLTGLFLLALAVAIAVGLPVSLLLLAAAALAPVLAGVLGPVVLGVLLWAFIYLFFTTDALFVTRVPPSLAMRYSILVVRRNFWPSLGFVALVIVISAGLAALWNEVAENFPTPGMILAILGHIYISTGLAAASMTYYKDRFDRITE
jgi:hypothetical protein